MGRSDYLRLGDWNALCDRCGEKRKASELQKDWQGYYLCSRCWEPRQPQDFVTSIKEVFTPPWVRNPGDVFVGVCSPTDMTGIAYYAVATCAICNYVSPLFDPTVND
jgi:hypothetical protein